LVFKLRQTVLQLGDFCLQRLGCRRVAFAHRRANGL